MKNLTKTFAVLLLSTFFFIPYALQAQCGPGETYNTYCYDDGEVNVVAFEFCPTAGDIAQSEIIAGSYSTVFPPAIEGLSVYEGASGTGTGGTLIFGPADGDLTGTVITASAPDLCLIFISNSNTFFVPSSCVDGFETTLEVCSESLPGTTVTFTALPDLCEDAGVQTGLTGGSPSGGTYSGPGVTDMGGTYNFDPSAPPSGAGVGTHTLTYTVGGNSASDDVEVFAAPTFTALADLCIDAGIQTGLGSGSPTGGIYSGPGVTNNGNGTTYSFDPGLAGLGVHTITYTSAAGCTATDDVEVLAACGCPQGQSSHFHCGGGVETNLVVFEVCPSAGMAAQATIEAGTYNTTGNNLKVYEGISGTGTTGTLVFGPATGDLATTVITGLGADQCLIFVSTSPSGLGCQQGFETALEVCGESIAPSLQFTALADLCEDAGIQTGLSGGFPVGGTYSGPGVTDMGGTYSFDPSAPPSGAGVGTHIITYTLGGGSATDDVEVFAMGTAGCVSFIALDDLCEDAGIQTGLSGGMPAGGMYSGPGVSDMGGTYDFDPSTLTGAGVGIHTITYTVGGNAVTDDVQVFDAPIVTFTAPDDVCSTAGSSLISLTGDPAGGAYSGPGVTNIPGANSYVFDPAAAMPGVHTLTYTYTDPVTGCIGSASDMVEVFDGSPATFTAPADLCIDAGIQIGLSGGLPAGGTYSGTGVTDMGGTYNFDPSAPPSGAGLGTHTITYTVTNGTCPTTLASDDIVVYDLPSVTLSAALYYCLDAPIQNITITGGSPNGGVYSGPGVTDNTLGTGYFLDPTVGGPGTITVTYTYTDANGCSNSASKDIDIFDCEFELTDPCNCLDNATVFDIDAMTGGNDGQFSELISVIDATGQGLPMGQTWTVTAVTGAFDANNIPPVGTQSVGTPVAVGTPLNFIPGLLTGFGSYGLSFVHVDAMGYSITVEGPFGVTSPANSTFTFENNCQYPNPVFDPVLQSSYCSNASSVPLGGTDQNGVAADPGFPTFTIDGIAATVFDPSMLALGPHTVIMTFDGENDGTIGTMANPASPGCIQTVQQVVNIANNPPVITCPVDIVIECDESTDPAINTLLGMATATDDCSTPVITFMDVTNLNGCGGYTGTITRTWSADDGVNPPVTCDQTITIVDTTPPIEPAPPGAVTVQCAEDVPPPVDLTAIDNCAAPITVSPTPNIMNGNCVNQFTMVRTWTFTDPCGNTSSVSQTITVDDTTPPTIQCPGPITVACIEDVPAPDITLPVTGDNCMAPVTITHEGDVSDGMTCPETITRTYRATDACGNVTECTQIITVNDIIDPTIVCPNPVTVACLQDVTAPDVSLPVTGDNCLAPVTTTHEGDDVNATACDGGTITRTYRATDACGNFTECTQVITVTPPAGPTIVCPADMTVQCAADIIVDANDAIVTTVCGFGFTTYITQPDIVGAEDCNGTTYTYTYKTIDDCGRTAECQQVFTIVNDGPQILLPNCGASNASASVYDNFTWNSGDNDGSGFGPWQLNPAFGNNFAGHFVFTSTENGAMADINGDNDIDTDQRAWGFYANNGNLSEAIRPLSQAMVTGSTLSLQIDNGFVDAGGTVGFGLRNSSGQNVWEFFFIGGNAGYTIQDASGSVNTGIGFTDEGLQLDFLQLDATTIRVTVTTLVNGQSQSFTSTLINQAGGQAISQIRLFNFNAGPDAPRNLYANSFVVCHPETINCVADINVDPSDATVTTSCGENLNVTIYSPEVIGEGECPGTIYVYTYRVEDQCEREATVDRVFVVGNNAPPTINAPDDVTCQCLAGVNANPNNALVTTACSLGYDVDVTGPVASGPMDCPGTTYTYTYTVTDACGRQASDTQTFTIQNDGPVFTNALTVPLQLNCEDQGWEYIIQAWLASVEATSSCGVPLGVTNNYNPNNQGLCISNGTTTVTFRATDQCGRQSQTTGMIIIADTEPPVFVEAAQDEIDICNYNTQQEFADWVTAHGNSIAYDGCWGDQIQWSTIPNNPSINCLGQMGSTSVTVTFVARDGCGNKASTTATFTALMTGGDFVEQGDGEVEVANNPGFELFQNQPNPFKEETLIGFNLPEATHATLTIYDISGKVLKTITRDYPSGYNSEAIDKAVLPSTGLFYYELKMESKSITKKMVLVK